MERGIVDDIKSTEMDGIKSRCVESEVDSP